VAEDETAGGRGRGSQPALEDDAPFNCDGTLGFVDDSSREASDGPSENILMGVSRPISVLGCFLKRRRIGAYLDGALTDRVAVMIGAHLDGCPRCQMEALGLRRLRELLRASVVAAEPEWTGFWPGIVRGIDAGAGSRVRTRPARVLLHRRAAMVGAVGAVLLAVTIWQGDSPVAPEAAITVAGATTEHPDGSVMVYTPPGDDMTVIWIFGLDKSPKAGAI
jgi:putative zinc finger protein